MAPVLEEPTRRPMDGAFQKGGVIRSQSREKRHEVSPRHDIDRVDLILREAIRDGLDIPHRDQPLELGDTEALRSERNSPRLSLAEPLPSHPTDATGTH